MDTYPDSPRSYLVRFGNALTLSAAIVPLLASIATLYIYAYGAPAKPLRTGLLATGAVWLALGAIGASFVGVGRANRSEYLSLRVKNRQSGDGPVGPARR